MSTLFFSCTYNAWLKSTISEYILYESKNHVFGNTLQIPNSVSQLFRGEALITELGGGCSTEMKLPH